MTAETEGPVPCRPWTLILEVAHLHGPAFDLDQHGGDVETAIIDRLRDVVVDLDSGTSVRVETYLHRTEDLEDLMEGQT